MWTKPKFEEMRLGFEVTMYISNREYIFKNNATFGDTISRVFLFYAGKLCKF
jgi:coenzyme PQQ precursor peptide PqqA